MTVVLVHGVPESAAVWDPLVAALGRPDVVPLSPPGFGAPVPDGFPATAAAYRDWLVAELERGGEPVDLVGHDWGGAHVVRVAVERPDLVRTWATDVGGCLAPDYEWHDLARTWQTPGAGEEAVAAMVAAPAADRAALYEALGMPVPVARAVADAADEAMGRCILALYRSAAQPAMAELGGRLAAAGARPGLVVVPGADPYTGGPERARWAAARAGAAVVELEGAGHWWPCAPPAEVVAALEALWESGAVGRP